MIRYAGIVSAGKALSAAQQATIVAYQQHYGVRWAVVGSTPTGLPGVTAGAAVNEVCLCVC